MAIISSLVLNTHFVLLVTVVGWVSSEVFELLVVVASLTLSTLGLVDLGNNWVANLLQSLEVVLKVFPVAVVVAAQPVGGLTKSLSDRVLVILINLVSKLL